MIENRPFASDTASAVLLMARLRTVTVAPGTAALDWSATRPPIAPAVVDCACSLGLNVQTRANTAATAHDTRAHCTYFILKPAPARRELREETGNFTPADVTPVEQKPRLVPGAAAAAAACS